MLGLFARAHRGIVLSLVACTSVALADPLTLPFTIGDGGATSSFTGSLGGSVTVTSKAQTTDGTVQTGASIDITDLDLRIRRRGSGLTGLLIPSIDANNLTADVLIGLNPTAVMLDIPTTSVSSGLTGSFTITAENDATDVLPGVLGGLTPGLDGAWDDEADNDSQLNTAQLNGFTATIDAPLSAAVNVTGGLSGGVISDVVIPDIYNTTLLNIDLRLKNSSTFSIDFDDVQDLSIEGLTISTSSVIPINIPTSNFVVGTHPLDGTSSYTPIEDLSAIGGGLVATTVSGTLNANIKGLVSASIDLAADISIIGVINFPINIDNVIDGPIDPESVDLLTLSEEITLPDVDLPFIITLLHEPTLDVDFDDVLAAITSGTLGLSLPFEINEQDVVITIPTLAVSLPATSFNFGSGLTSGTAFLDTLSAEIGGSIVTDINAHLNISADLIAGALRQNAINVPEIGTIWLAGLAIAGAAGVRWGRRRRQ